MKIINEAANSGGNGGGGVQGCGETFCLIIGINTPDADSVRQQIPTHIAGYEVRASIKQVKYRASDDD